MDHGPADILSRLDEAFRRYRAALEIELRLLGLVPLDLAQELRGATESAKKAWQNAERLTQERREAAHEDSGLTDLDRAQRSDAARA